ncbi:MAG: pyruvate dehydrogenase (acetyl-transferring) E1 component subunit alpha [Rhodocyclaceae bacterium]|nr:pyruvate dehydrogenase (acetyl-transferring) E1 component subunit alpha [Rhodocyclaceae bacterium]
MTFDHHAAAPPAGPVPWDRDFALRLLADMVRIRRMEEKSAEMYGAGKIRGFLHLYIGEEATAVGALHALSPEDNIVATYREHGHALVRGMDMGAIMAEMYGKYCGCAHGRGGSMHLFDARTRLFGGNAIVGGGLPLAVGLGLAAKMSNEKRLTACFFGDGAVAEGAFHESLNLAALWKLPVLFCCENNLYGMGTALERSESQTDLCVKAASYNMPALRADGMDIVAVHEVTKQAVQRVREGCGPVFVEYQTYRFRAHSMFDAELYRQKAEVEEWKTRGPIHTFSARLKAEGKLTEEEFLALDAAANAEVGAAVAFAEAGTWEPVEDLLKDVMTPPPPGPRPGGGDGCSPPAAAPFAG